MVIPTNEMIAFLLPCLKKTPRSLCSKIAPSTNYWDHSLTVFLVEASVWEREEQTRFFFSTGPFYRKGTMFLRDMQK